MNIGMIIANQMDGQIYLLVLMDLRNWNYQYRNIIETVAIDTLKAFYQL